METLQLKFTTEKKKKKGVYYTGQILDNTIPYLHFVLKLFSIEGFFHFY